MKYFGIKIRGLNLLFASTSAGANRSYYGSSYTSINDKDQIIERIRVIQEITIQSRGHIRVRNIFSSQW